MELESFFDGTLVKLFAAAGARVPIGSALCAIGKPGEIVTAPVQTTDGGGQKAAKAPAAVAPAPTPVPSAPVPPTVVSPPPSPITPAGRVRISPLAKKLAADMGINPAQLTGSGPGGRIVRADVETAAAAPKAPQSQITNFKSQITAGPIQEDKVVPVSNVRGIIAKRLLESKTTIPHFYLDIEINAAPLLELRAQLNAALEADGVKLSVNDFILKAAAGALRRVPAVNCSWEGAPSTGSGQPAIRHHGAAHVSFAVAIEDGLITPVIRDTHLKSLFAVSTEAKDLGKRAKSKKLAPAEFTGGTFCVTNLGMLGIDRFCAIINPPNAAILAVGATVKKPVVVNDAIVIGQRMNLTLACDHRVVDGAVGAAYLAALRELLEKPALLLL
jgi:pyruvate dehydrogenase E2 component (dihydrolipoamide acetyltransferase)